MPSHRNMLLADRWERLRKLADGTRTLESLAFELGITYAAMRKMASKDPSLDIPRATRKDLGEERNRRIRFRSACLSPVGKDGEPALEPGKNKQPCGICDACERNDEEDKIPVERCRCGLAMPCHQCVGTIRDYMYASGDATLRRGNGMSGTGIH